MSVVGPNNEWKLFDVKPGQVVFVPMGFFHYFENIGKHDLHFLVSFNNSGAESDDDIGVSVSLGGTPRHVLAATFGYRSRCSIRFRNCTRKSRSCRASDSSLVVPRRRRSSPGSAPPVQAGTALDDEQPYVQSHHPGSKTGAAQLAETPETNQ